jgi:hypothetical protein
VDLIGCLLILPKGFTGFSINGDQLSSEVSGVNAILYEDGGTCEANVIVVAPDLYFWFKN